MKNAKILVWLKLGTFWEIAITCNHISRHSSRYRTIGPCFHYLDVLFDHLPAASVSAPLFFTGSTNSTYVIGHLNRMLSSTCDISTSSSPIAFSMDSVSSRLWVLHTVSINSLMSFLFVIWSSVLCFFASINYQRLSFNRCFMEHILDEFTSFCSFSFSHDVFASRHKLTKPDFSGGKSDSFKNHKINSIIRFFDLNFPEILVNIVARNLQIFEL